MRPPPATRRACSFLAEVAGLAAALLEQMNAVDGHAALDRLHHVVDGEAGDRDRGERFHLDAGLAFDLDGRAHDEPRQLMMRLDLDLDLRDRQGMAEGNE